MLFLLQTILSGINPKPEIRNFLVKAIRQSSSDEYLGHTTSRQT